MSYKLPYEPVVPYYSDLPMPPWDNTAYLVSLILDKDSVVDGKPTAETVADMATKTAESVQSFTDWELTRHKRYIVELEQMLGDVENKLYKVFDHFGNQAREVAYGCNEASW